ncbi:TPA: LPXTG cell wall anchor domain-containing protein, partial [Streptococcus suis]|nr:LPXTG cell wall anchor domain-containing protein [Streptococcus suis]
TTTDENGNVKHVFKKVVTPVKEVTTESNETSQLDVTNSSVTSGDTTSNDGTVLPNTGEESSISGVLGISLLVAALSIAGYRRKED